MLLCVIASMYIMSVETCLPLSYIVVLWQTLQMSAVASQALSGPCSLPDVKDPFILFDPVAKSKLSL